jgi:Yip1 domain
MPLITRVKNILLSPKTEWELIRGETETPQSLLGKYVIPMALVPAVALFIGYGLIGIDAVVFRISGIRWGAIMAVNSFVTSILTYYICTFVVDALAPSFSSEKNIGRSAQLVAYSYTAVWVAGIFNIIPSLSILGILGLYSIYLFYLGVPVMKKTPEDKRIIYMIVSAIVIFVVGYVVNMIVARIMYTFTGNPFLPEGSLQDLRWR